MHSASIVILSNRKADATTAGDEEHAKGVLLRWLVFDCYSLHLNFEDLATHWGPETRKGMACGVFAIGVLRLRMYFTS